MSDRFNYPVYVQTQDSELLQKILFEAKNTRAEIVHLRQDFNRLQDLVKNSKPGSLRNEETPALFEVFNKVRDSEKFEENERKFISNLKENVQFRNKLVSVKAGIPLWNL